MDDFKLSFSQYEGVMICRVLKPVKAAYAESYLERDFPFG